MNIYHTILKAMDSGLTLYMLTVVESKGSAPGRRGFKMLVLENAELFGSIGGGIMEFNMVEKAKTLLQNKKYSHFLIRQDHHGNSKETSGMICSGSQIIAFNVLFKEDKATILKVLETGQGIELSHKGVQSIKNVSQQVFYQSDNTSWVYKEITQFKPQVHIFGAGHVSLPTSQLLTRLGFSVNLYDNRDSINTYLANNSVKNKRIITYENINQDCEINQRDYVLLMTHKFTEDKLLLSQLCDQKIHYIGVLGSQNKIDVMFKALHNEGVKQQQLDKIHAPVGLAIQSQTVEEIAVSIVAQIIKYKNIGSLSLPKNRNRSEEKLL